MKCHSFVVLLFLCTIGLFAVESPLRNLDFSQKGEDGKFTYWAQKGNAAEYKADNGTLTITPLVTEDAKFLMQYPVEFQSGGKYSFSYERRGAAGMQTAVYFEYRNSENKLTGINDSLSPVKEEWTSQKIDFTMPESFAGAYLVIMMGAGNGSCQFRNIKLECLGVTGFAALARMKDAVNCFATPLDVSAWRKLGEPSGTAEFAENTLKLNLNAAQGTVFYLKQLNLQPGVKYEISAKVRLGAGKYGFYMEYTNAQGKRPSINGNFLPANGTGAFPVSLTAVMPEGAQNIVLILAAKDAPDGVEFSDLQIKEVAPPADPTSVSSWQGGQKEQVAGGNFQLVIIDGATAVSRVQLRKEQFYRFSFDGATRKSKDLTGFATFQFRAKIGDRPVFLSDWDDLLNNRGSSKAFVFQAPESGLGTFEISSRGEIVLKEMRLDEIIPAEASPVELTLNSPAYRNTIFDSRRQEIVGNLNLKSPAASAEITLAPAATPNHPLIRQKSQGGSLRLSGSLQLPVGDYLLVVTPQDAQGKKLQNITTEIHILKEPKVCYRYDASDNTFYLNDTPIHYHGFMHGYLPELAWLYRYYGVTTFAALAGDPQQLLPQLDKAQSFGFRLLLDLRVNYFQRDKKDFLADWERYMDYLLTPQVLNHPALAGYISADEPAWCGFPFNQLEAITKFIHKKDPTRPVWINEAPRGSVELNRRVAALSDTFGVDIYPIPYPNGHSGLEDKTITSVGAYTRRCREAAGSNTPIWMVLQGFAWNDLNHRPDAVYPTAAESRFMALEAMVNGANADIYYGVNSIKNAKFYLEILQTIGEAGLLSRLWQAGNTLKIPAAAGMKIFAGTVDGQRYIVALNTTPQALDSQLDLTGFYELPDGKPAKNPRFEKYSVRVFASVPRYPGDFTQRPAYDKAKESHALAILNKYFAPTEKYQGKAQWIWYPGDAKALVCDSILALDFSMNASPVKAQLLVAADDEGFVTLNGQAVGKAGGWKTMENYPVHKLLKQGKNRLEVQVASMGAPPSGLLLELQVEYADGSSQTFVTGPDWQAIKPGVPAKPVEVIAPYGGGAWDSKVEFYQ